MDKEKKEEQAVALRKQSQWLQTSLSDLDSKINAILSIIVQDDGDSLAKRAEMYYEKRPVLIQMVEDLHKSYRSIAEKYDQLRPEAKRDSHPTPLPLSSQELNGRSNFHSKSSTAEDPDDEREEKESDDSQAAVLENEKLWNELRFQVSELVEDNLSHQAELIRRNGDERETIRELSSKMHMPEENVKKSQSKSSTLKTLCFGTCMKNK